MKGAWQTRATQEVARLFHIPYSQCRVSRRPTVTLSPRVGFQWSITMLFVTVISALVLALASSAAFTYPTPSVVQRRAPFLDGLDCSKNRPYLHELESALRSLELDMAHAKLYRDYLINGGDVEIRQNRTDYSSDLTDSIEATSRSMHFLIGEQETLKTAAEAFKRARVANCFAQQYVHPAPNEQKRLVAEHVSALEELHLASMRVSARGMAAAEAAWRIHAWIDPHVSATLGVDGWWYGEI